MRYILFILAVTIAHGLFAQDESRFRNFHGLTHPQSGERFFEGEGYSVSVQFLNFGMNEKGISKIKKKYGFAKDLALATDSVTQLKTLSRIEQTSGITASLVYYLIPVSEESTTVIGFAKANKRDTGLEQFFVTAYRDRQIPDFVYTSTTINSIDFAGRTIQLGPVCQWMGPHNVQCPDYGQMNWSIFNTLKEAEEYRDLYIGMTGQKNMVDVKEGKWITVKFEGKETKAYRTKNKIQLPKFVMGGSNVLIAYYVSGEVRGKYVACILSHYTDDVGARTLPPLLKEVLELTE